MSWSMLHLITSTDIFGQGVEFKINNEYKSKTFFGGMLSIILVFLLFCMFFFSCQDLFYKTNPQVNVEQKILSEPPKIVLNKWTMPFAVSIVEGKFPVFKPDYFKFSALSFYGSTRGNMSQQYFNFTRCKKEFFPLISQEIYDKLEINHSLCIENMNITMFGSWVEPEISFLTLSLSFCLNDPDCASIKEITDYVQSNDLFINVYYMNTVINPQDYTAPAIYNMNTLYNRIRLSTTKSSSIFIREQRLISDDGFIFKSNSLNDSIALDTIIYDDYNDYSYNLINFYIFPSLTKIVTSRIYLKLQSVLADVGGIATILRITFSTCCYIFSIVRRDEIILNQIFEFDLVGSTNKNKRIEFRRSAPIINCEINSNVVSSINNNYQIEDYFPVRNTSNKSVNYNQSKQLDEVNSSKRNRSHTVNNKNVKLDKNELSAREKDKLKEVNTMRQTKTKEKVNRVTTDFKKKLKDAKEIIEVLKSRNHNYRLTFSFFEIWRAFICCEFNMKPYIKSKKALYKKSIFAIDEFLDISNMVHRFEELEKLKIVLLNNDQLALFNFINKEFMSLDEEKISHNHITKYKRLFRNQEHLANIIINYRDKMIHNNEVQEIDQKLFSLLNEEFK